MYENESLFDRFDCHTSLDGQHIMTGGYSSSFTLIDVEQRIHSTLYATHD
jgi:hypothetical protein